MHVVTIAVGLVLLASFLLRVALKRFPSSDIVTHAELPCVDRFPNISKPLRVAWPCVDFANFLFLLTYIVLLGWALLFGPIRLIHEWFR